MINITQPTVSGTDGRILLNKLFNLGIKFLKGATPEESLGVPTLTSLALKTSNTIIMIPECILTVSQEKNIITTPLAGRNGTIKEYISDKDYTIEVAAGIQPEAIGGGLPPDRYPMEELNKLMKVLQASESLETQSDFLTLFGITAVVVKSYRFAQETHSNRQTFSMTMVSDTPYEIKITEDA